MRRRYRITNETRFRTDDLRKLIHAAADRVFDPDDQPLIQARIQTSRGDACRGRAWVGGTAMVIRLPKTIGSMRNVGALIVHELGHLRGLRHPDMRGSARWTWRGLKPKQEAGVILTPWDQWMAAHAWAEAFELRVKPERVKVRPTGAALADVKRERVSAAIARWESKAKRAANALKKLRAKARYYDRRAAAMRGAR